MDIIIVLIFLTLIIFVMSIRANNVVSKYLKDREYYEATGAILGKVTLDGRPIESVFCNIKESDGNQSKWSKQWISYTRSDGYYEIKNIIDGKYICEYTYIFKSGRVLNEQLYFEISDGLPVILNLNIDNNK